MDYEISPKFAKRRRLISAITAIVLIVFLIGNSFAFVLPELLYQEESTDTQTELAQLSVPVTVHLLTGSENSDTSRSRAEVDQIMQQSIQIWSQAAIGFEYEIIETEVGDAVAESIDDGSYTELINSFGYSADGLQLFFVRDLNGIFGVAIPGGIALVSDIIPAGAFRTTAHELGHLLGLPHSDFSRSRLLYPGTTGIELSMTEINIARNTIQLFF